MPSGLFYLNSLDRSISYIRGVWFLLLSYFVEFSEVNANHVDPDQTSWSVASDLGLHSLPVSLLWDTRIKWVNGFLTEFSSRPWLLSRMCVRLEI